MSETLKKPEKLICDSCGGTDITIDAVVRWDIDAQEFTIADILDGQWCGTCDEAYTTWVDVTLTDAALIAIKNQEKSDGISK